MRNQNFDEAADAAKALADRLFPSAEELDTAESILDVPPEQRKLHTETFDFSVSTIASYLTQGSVVIPSFQRRYVWSEAQASRLIESLIIQCPIPVIYLNQAKDERLEVIDGNQRLTTIRRFMDDLLILRGLTSYPELEGNTYSTLDSRFRRHIENRTLRCIVILKDTHPQVKFDVFERLNTGSTKLSPQEVRNGLYHGRLTSVLRSIARTSIWREAAPRVERMKGEELALRFLAFYFERHNYQKPLNSFLNNFCEQHRNCSEEDAQRFESLCIQTMASCNALFGQSAFKLVDMSGAPVRGLNAALFESEMVAAAEVPGDYTAAKGERILRQLGERFSNDYDFYRSVSYATSDEAAVAYRHRIVKETFEANL